MNVQIRKGGLRMLQKFLDQGVIESCVGGNVYEDSSESYYRFMKLD